MLIAANLFAAGQETTARLIATMLRYFGERPELQQAAARRTRPHPGVHRGDAAARDPAPRASSAWRGCPTTVGGVDISRGHDGDDAQRRGEPRPAPVRRTRTSSASTGRTAASTSGSGSASTRARARRSPAPRPGSASSASSTAWATSRISEADARSGRRPPLRVHAHLPAPRPRATPPRVHPVAMRTAVTALVRNRAELAARCRRTTSSSATSCGRG